jgi:hypothetical protein
MTQDRPAPSDDPAPYGQQPHVPQAYVAQAYAQYAPPHDHPSGYGPQYALPGYPGHPSGARPTNTMAILALVLAFVCAPLGIVFGLIGRNQIRRTGEAGGGLALAGIIIGAALTVLVVAYLVVLAVLLSAAVSSVPPFPVN